MVVAVVDPLNPPDWLPTEPGTATPVKLVMPDPSTAQTPPVSGPAPSFDSPDFVQSSTPTPEEVQTRVDSFQENGGPLWALADPAVQDAVETGLTLNNINNSQGLVTIDPGFAQKHPSEAFAGITRQQYKLWERLGKPAETWLLNQVGEPLQPLLQTIVSGAGTLAWMQTDPTRARAEFERRASRLASALTPEQQRAMNYDLTAGREEARSFARNTARERQTEFQRALIQDLFSLGAGGRAAAVSGLGGAASAYAAREADYYNRLAQYESGKQRMLGQGLGFAIGLGMGM